VEGGYHEMRGGGFYEDDGAAAADTWSAKMTHNTVVE
jgi:hypothetical protein